MVNDWGKIEMEKLGVIVDGTLNFGVLIKRTVPSQALNNNKDYNTNILFFFTPRNLIPEPLKKKIKVPIKNIHKRIGEIVEIKHLIRVLYAPHYIRQGKC